jgi:hypothetical protein
MYSKRRHTISDSTGEIDSKEFGVGKKEEKNSSRFCPAHTGRFEKKIEKNIV